MTGKNTDTPIIMTTENSPLPLATAAKGGTTPAPSPATDPWKWVAVFALFLTPVLKISSDMANERILNVSAPVLSLIVIISTALALVIILYWQRLRTLYSRSGNKPGFLLGCIIAGVLIVAVLLSLISFITPVFQITSPGSGAMVGPDITVTGNGAIPGNPVSVIVIDDLKHPWDQGQSIPSQRGEWSLDNVIIGRAGLDSGKNYTIYAETRNNEGKTVYSNSVKVIRK
jgi:hypothetical protein